MTAAVIDGGVVAVVLLGCYAAFAVLKFMVDPLGFTWPDTSLPLSLTAAFVVLVLYLTVSWAATGRSYGSHVMGLRVVGARGRKLGVVGSFLRALTCALFPVGLLWCAVSPANRSLQDLLLRTSVVYDWQPHAPR